MYARLKHGSMDERRRIPPFAEDTLEVLTDAASGAGEASEKLSRDEAIGVITNDERFDRPGAKAALETLQSRGYIYYVGESVRITPTDD